MSVDELDVCVSDADGVVRRAAAIHNLEDPRLRPFVGLKTAPTPPDRFVAESGVVIGRAIAAGFEALTILVHADRRRPLPFRVGPSTGVVAVESTTARQLSGEDRPDDMLALFRRPPSTPAAQVLASAERVVALDGVTNPINLGIILRTVAALGVDAVLLGDGCADPLHRRATRVAMGEGFAAAWARTDGEAIIDVLHRCGFEVVALSPTPTAPELDEAFDAVGRRCALLLGAEGPGLDPDTMGRADCVGRIPIQAGVDSLNVAAAAAIACWELVRRREGAGD